MANLSLEHGHSDGSCFATSVWACSSGTVSAITEPGFSFGKLGLDLVEQRGLRRFEAGVDLNFGGCLLPGRSPFAQAAALVRRAFDVAIRLGDLTYAGYARSMPITHLLATGSARRCAARGRSGVEFARQLRHGSSSTSSRPSSGYPDPPRLDPDFVSFNDAAFDEDASSSTWRRSRA